MTIIMNQILNKYKKSAYLSFQLIVHYRGVVSTGPLARGHLIWPPGHLLLDSTGPDWPPKFEPYLLKKNYKSVIL